MLLTKAPESDDALTKRIQDLAKNESALPTGDRSLRDVLHSFDRFLNVLETLPPVVQRGLTLLKPGADFPAASARVKSIISSMVQAIEAERTNRLREKPIDSKAIGNLRDAAERAMMTQRGGVPFFRGFSIQKTPHRDDGEVFTFRLNGLTKAQFVDPPMESETLGFTDHYAQLVTQQAGRWAWGLFTQRARETVAVPSRIEEPAFWGTHKGPCRRRGG